MHFILLSGGSGTRLWPLSNDVRAKQFLRLLPAPGGGTESMLQRVMRQVQEVGAAEIVIAAGIAQADQLRGQAGGAASLVLEPQRRDTFPAIALACAWLCSEGKASPDEVAAVLPVDTFAETDYFRKIFEVEQELARSDADLILLGAAPLYPSEKYGYILPKHASSAATDTDVRIRPPAALQSESVASFREKPDRVAAEALIVQGALWNCGVFGLRIGYVLDILKNKYGMTEVSYQSVRQGFDALPCTSFDYEVVEYAKNTRVLRYEGCWKDLGTWESLTEEITPMQGENITLDPSCAQTHIVNETDLPIVAMGLKNVVVAASYDGILVAEKSEAWRLKDVAKAGRRVMFEERRWGRYKVFEHVRYGENEVLTKRLSISAGQQISYQLHRHRKEIWTILSGEGVLYLEGKKRAVRAGEVVSVEVGMRHGILARTDLEILEVQLGDPLIEEDIIRIEYDWA